METIKINKDYYDFILNNIKISLENIYILLHIVNFDIKLYQDYLEAEKYPNTKKEVINSMDDKKQKLEKLIYNLESILTNKEQILETLENE